MELRVRAGQVRHVDQDVAAPHEVDRGVRGGEGVGTAEHELDTGRPGSGPPQGVEARDRVASGTLAVAEFPQRHRQRYRASWFPRPKSRR